MRPRLSVRPSHLVLAAVLVGIAGSAVGSAVYVWGPLHAAYEQVCNVYPPLRTLGPLPLAMLGAGLLSGFVAAALTFVQSLRAASRASWRLRRHRAPLSARLAAFVDELDLVGRVVVVRDTQPYAFCHGILDPSVYVTTGLVELLGDDELRAVLAHERAHLRHRDPLRNLAARMLSRLMLFVPLHEEAYRSYRLGRELGADREAVGVTSRPQLASALLKLLGSSEPHPPRSSAVVAFGDLEERIRHISDAAAPSQPRLPWDLGLGQAAMRSGVTLLLFGALATTSQEVVVGCLI